MGRGRAASFLDLASVYGANEGMLFCRHFLKFLLLITTPAVFSGCLCHQPGQFEKRKGDEIVAAGKFFHAGTKVVLWMDPGGYDAYRVQRRFAPIEESDWEDSRKAMGPRSAPNRYGTRDQNLTKEELERVRGGGWDLPLLQSNVDQFVLHFDVAGVSRNCFKTLHDARDLSVHFMLDLDGTIYQTLDLKERAWHATSSNNRSVGIEIANIGSYNIKGKDPLNKWYTTNANGRVIITIPAAVGPDPERTPHFVGHPARREVIVGEGQGETLRQYDYTPQQYKALAKLTATLCTIFPKIICDYPREADGKLMTHKLPGPELKNYQGVLGHYHIQTDKVDPGPALQWDYVIGEARRLMKEHPQRSVAGEPLWWRPKLIVDN
jgi:N-acetylmuramoyl-L-alanine amidase